MFANLGVILTLIVGLFAHAETQVVEHIPGTDVVSIKLVSNIRLTEGLSVAGNWVCHDGLYIYFDSEDSCKESNRSENNLYKHNCTGSLEIIPVREIEFIHVNTAENEFLTRFYKVATEYTEQTITMNRADFSKLSEINSMDEIGFQASNITSKEISLCKGRHIYPPTNILADEREGSVKEKYLAKALIDADLPIVNSPYGRTEAISVAIPLRHSSPLNQPELQSQGLILLQKMSSTSLSGQLFNPKEIDFPGLEDQPDGLKSPFCNFAYSEDRIWFLAGGGGGHVGGGGFSSFRTDTLQEISKDLWLEPTVDNKQLEQYLSEEYDPEVRLFETGCGGVDL